MSGVKRRRRRRDGGQAFLSSRRTKGIDQGRWRIGHGTNGLELQIGLWRVHMAHMVIHWG